MPRSVRTTPVGRLGDEIASHPMFAGDQQSGVTVTFEGGQLAVEERLPDEQLMESWLLRMRPFLLVHDDAHLATVVDLAITHIDDARLVHSIESARHGYDQAAQSLGVRLVRNNQEMTPERAAGLWLNGVYFHHDADKEAELMSHLPMEAALVRDQFLAFMKELTRVVVWSAARIREAEQQGVIRDDPVPLAKVHPIGNSPAT